MTILTIVFGVHFTVVLLPVRTPADCWGRVGAAIVASRMANEAIHRVGCSPQTPSPQQAIRRG